VYQAALKTYDSVNKATMSGRDIEAEVLTKAALKLKTFQDHWSDNGKNEGLHSVLKYNQRVWTILQAEIEKPENPLPINLKANLLRLSAFIDRRTIEMLANPAPEKLTILIHINQNIAAGLRSRPLAGQDDQVAA
jgi:flagellar protein FlaF